MKLLGMTPVTVAVLALFAAAPAFAQSNAGPVPPQGQGPIRGSSVTQKPLQQKAANGELSPQQNAQLAVGCTPADQTCGDANGNPGVNSPGQKRQVPVTGQTPGVP